MKTVIIIGMIAAKIINNINRRACLHCMYYHCHHHHFIADIDDLDDLGQLAKRPQQHKNIHSLQFMNCWQK